jgi:hypothetical protein
MPELVPTVTVRAPTGYAYALSSSGLVG